MRPTEWSAGAIRQNILPPTLNTATPSHCTMRVVAGRLAQNLSICLGVIVCRPEAKPKDLALQHGLVEALGPSPAAQDDGTRAAHRRSRYKVRHDRMAS